MNADLGPARRRRTAVLGAIAIVLALLSTSCAAGRVAQTIRQRPTIPGVNADLGPISIRNLTVETPPKGTSYPQGSALRLVGVFVDNGTSSDVLTEISSPSFTSWGAYSSIAAGDEVVAAAAGGTAATPAASSTAGAPQASRAVRIPANGRTSFGVPDATGSLLALTTKSVIYPGSIVTMTLTFARAGTITVRVPVNITTNPTQSILPAPSGSESGD